MIFLAISTAMLVVALPIGLSVWMFSIGKESEDWWEQFYKDHPP